MLLSSSKNTGPMAGAFISFIFVASAQASYAQSATDVSDDDYLSALTTMASDMDLNGLAGQTFAPITVAAPQLPKIVMEADVVSCDVIQAQAAASGRPIEIFGDESALSDAELSSRSICMIADSGALVSYVMSES
jgi:hypothetical protein